MNARAGLYGVGQEFEQEAAKRLATNGWIVIPVSEYANNTGAKINAPMLVSPKGVAISPDLLAMKAGEKSFWFEVKDKSEPTYTWKFGRWEHGIDKPNADDYKTVQENSGIPVVILIHERNSPKTPDLYLSSSDDIGAYRKMKADLQPSNLWLWVYLDDAIKHGNVRANNPEMTKPNNPTGSGLYWPRSIMKEWRTACQPTNTPGTN